MSVTINGSGTITSSTGTLGFGDENLTTTGTIPAAQLTGTMPAVNGAAITALNATNLGSGTVPTARLGSGTASSSTFLAGDQTYKTVAAGLNHITTVTASNSASIDIASTLTDTYNSYFVTFANLLPASNNTEFVMLFSTDNGSSFVAGSAYVYNIKHFYTGPSGDGNSESTGDSSIRLALAVSSTAADGGISGYMYIHSPTNSAVKTYVNFSAFMKMGDGSNTAASLVGGGYVGSATDDDAFQIKNESGNITSGTVRVYGIANS